MGQKDLSAKELTSYPDVVADLINVFVYGGKEVVHSEEGDAVHVGSGFGG